jgi:uncharacterized lipoprotein YajG
MYKISLIVVLAAAVLLSGCHTKGYTRAMSYRTQSAQSNTNQVAGQPHK